MGILVFLLITMQIYVQRNFGEGAVNAQRNKKGKEKYY